MPTRYLSRSELLALVRESAVPLAEQASAALDPTDSEMLPVRAGGLDVKTYEVRLARAEAGEGPSTSGLRGFVEALRRPRTEAETVAFQGKDGTMFVVLLDHGQVAAITSVAPG